MQTRRSLFIDSIEQALAVLRKTSLGWVALTGGQLTAPLVIIGWFGLTKSPLGRRHTHSYASFARSEQPGRPEVTYVSAVHWPPNGSLLEESEVGAAFSN